MSLGVIILIILVILLLGGFSGLGGGPFYGTGYYGGGGARSCDHYYFDLSVAGEALEAAQYNNRPAGRARALRGLALGFRRKVRKARQVLARTIST